MRRPYSVPVTIAYRLSTGNLRDETTNSVAQTKVMK
jgi:hypothetical protein